MFKLRFKILLNDKTLLFWSAIFPIILATLFHFVLTPIYEGATMEPIAIGVSQEVFDEYEPVLNGLIDNDVITMKTYNEQDAQPALVEESINAYVQEKNGKLIIQSTKETMQTEILKTVLTTYDFQRTLIENELVSNPQKIQEFVAALIDTAETKKAEEQQKSVIIIHFYTTVAMMIMYSGQWGQKSAEYMNPQHSKVGIRIGLSPRKKSWIVTTDLLAVFAIFIVQLALQTLFLQYVFNVPLLDNAWQYITTCLSGGVLSISLGYFVGVYFQNENLRNTFISMFGIFSTFLAGMQSIDIKRIIDTKMPFINLVNPASLMTDNFYYIYMGSDASRIHMNIYLMLLYGIILAIMSYRKLKELSYEHL